MNTSSFICPYCETGLEIPDDVRFYTCSSCGHRLNLDSQFAYLRGLEAFSEGQEIMQAISPRNRRKALNPRDKQAMNLFLEAYTAIQVAFRAELVAEQCPLALEMMSSMANEFMKRNMVSPFEANYWNYLLVEVNSHKEYDRIKEKLASSKGPLFFLQRLRWSIRQRQLLKALEQLDIKLRILEKNIEFVEVPRARDTHWHP